MATDDPTITFTADHKIQLYTYAGLDNGDDGTPIRCDTMRAVSVEAKKTFGTGGSISFEGSNVAAPSADGDYFVLSDAAGNALTFTAKGGDDIAADVLWIRPHVTAGDGSTDIDASIILAAR